MWSIGQRLTAAFKVPSNQNTRLHEWFDLYGQRATYSSLIRLAVKFSPIRLAVKFSNSMRPTKQKVCPHGLEQAWGTCGPREHLIWHLSDFLLLKLEHDI